MNIPKALQDKPLTQDLVAGMSAIVDSKRGQKVVDSREPRRGHMGNGSPTRRRDRYSITRF